MTANATEQAGGGGEEPSRPTGLHDYPPLEALAMIGDLRTIALVGRGGAIEWLCLPDIGSASIFASLLDRVNGGSLLVGPADGGRGTRCYTDGTAILQSRFETEQGCFTVTDFLHLFPRDGRGTTEPERELIRIVEVVEGTPEIRFHYEPRPEYALADIRLQQRGKLGWTFQYGADLTLLRTDIACSQQGQRLEGTERLRAGERRYVSLSFCRRDIGVIPTLGAESERKRTESEEWWRGWIDQCCYCGPFRDAVRRSLVTLRQLTMSQTGAVVAAATTSLPEQLGGTRNWDYRFCWLRDAYFVLAAFIRSGFEMEAKAYFNWLMHATQIDAPRLGVVYDIFGRGDLTERTLPTLEGYCRSGPVRVGNAAHDQLQLDSYGSVIRAAAEYLEGGGDFGRSESRRLRQFGDVVCSAWTNPDNGIWEMRRGRLHHSYSKAMCWSALDDLLALEAAGRIRLRRERYELVRDQIRESFEEAWNPGLGAFAGAYGEDFLDASALLLPKIGIVAADDPRMIATFERIDERLSDGPFVWRYSHEIDGVGGPEGAFLACGFWAAEYLAMLGETGEAERRLRALVEVSSDVGLLSEEYDPGDRRLLGNYPQAFSHAALINAAMALETARKEDDG